VSADGDVLLVLDARTGPAGVPYTLVQVEWVTVNVRPVVRIVASYTGWDGEAASYVLRGSTEAFPGHGVVRTYVDPQCPIGRTVTYGVEWASSVSVGDWSDSMWDGTSVSASVAVPELGRVHILTHPGDLTGAAVLPLLNNGLPRSTEQIGSLIRVQGRAAPVPLWDVRSSESGSAELWCQTPAQLSALSALLSSGAPVMSRHGNTSILFHPDREVWHAGGVSWQRRGHEYAVAAVEFTVVDDPEPDVLATVGTFADIDASLDEGLTASWTFADVATYLTGLGLSDFADVAAYDWWTEAL
jgi:hypothetical protein